VEPLTSLPDDACRALRVVFSDIDDTLTTGGHVPPRVLDLAAALAETGVAFCVVTGRPAGFGDALTTYFGMIDCAITENGGALSVGGASDVLFDAARDPSHAAALARAVAAVRAAFPAIREDPNNYMRRGDFAFRRDPGDDARVAAIAAIAAPLGVAAVASSIQVHLHRGAHTKATAIQAVLRDRFPGTSAAEVLTMGDSPNDAAMFDPAAFPLSVGVANVRRYADRMPHLPRYVATAEGSVGAIEVLSHVLARRR
jgi:HAD superfamily hydrolase (TIGR01484 family)